MSLRWRRSPVGERKEEKRGAADASIIVEIFFGGNIPFGGKDGLSGKEAVSAISVRGRRYKTDFFLGFFRSQAPHVVSHTPMSISGAFLSFLFTRSSVSGSLSLIYQDANELSHYFRNFMRELISFVLAPLFSLGE